MATLKRKQSIIYGYIHEQKALLNIEIPTDIMDVIILFYSIFEWDSETSHSSLIIDGNTISGTEHNLRSAFGLYSVSKGCASWKVKIKSRITLVGIIQNKSIAAGSRHFWKVSGGFGYYSSNGNCFKQRNNSYREMWETYGERYKDNDVITVYLNLDKEELSFSKNNKNQGIIPWKIPKNTKYHLAVAVCGTGDKVEFIEMN